MTVLIRSKRFTASLPSIPCTPEMRQALVGLSDKDQASLTQVMRTALQHYLAYRKVTGEGLTTSRPKYIVDQE